MLREPVPQFAIQNTIFMKCLFDPENMTVRRFSQDPFRQVQVIAVVGIQHDGDIWSQGLSHTMHHCNVSCCPLFQVHMPRTTSHFDLECPVASLVALNCFLCQQLCSLRIGGEVEIV